MFNKCHNKNCKKLFGRNGQAVAVLIGQCGILVGKWPMANYTLGGSQGLLRFNHFVDAAIYNHVQTSRNNACRQTIET